MNDATKTLKLSPAQIKMLKSLTTNGKGYDIPPGGYSTAGRDAARWYATMEVLNRLGLVEIPVGKNGFKRFGMYRITQAGRDLAAKL